MKKLFSWLRIILRPLFYRRVMFILNQNGQNQMSYGYVIFWTSLPNEFSKNNETGKFNFDKLDVFVIIETEDKHPKLGYQTCIVESQHVNFV